jgi:hypothetical protein
VAHRGRNPLPCERTWAGRRQQFTPHVGRIYVGRSPAVGDVSHGGGGGITGGLTSGGMTIGGSGGGGKVTVAYLNLTGISTVNITIGAGGTGGGSSADASGGRAGGRGEVIVEYVAA